VCEAKTVLIVDDEKSIRDLLSKILTREGYQTLTAGDGIEALQSIITKEIDLVVSDVIMPESDGIDLLIKARKAKPGIPFILISGGIDTGCVPFVRICEAFSIAKVLTKPINSFEFASAVRLAISYVSAKA
jgi:two-component system response regulator (stage 0 sporulation protein F)